MKRSLGAAEWVRKALGALVLVGVAAIALGLDTRVLSKLSTAQTSSFETGLARTLGVGGASPDSANASGSLTLPVEGVMPPLDGATLWLNSPPLTGEQLRGKVVVIDFWTYSCINCIRSIPYVRAWYDRYKENGLVVIGVHAPEFAFEKNPANVRKAIADLGITYPVALDNDYAIWRAFGNRYWPAHYFIDAKGRIRYHHFGEGNYAESEMVIRKLLAEAGHAPKTAAMGAAAAQGAEAAAAMQSLGSPETYIGYARMDRFVSPGGVHKDRAGDYRLAPTALNQWALEGRWNVGPQSARLLAPNGAIDYRFHARDLHLVLGSPTGKPIRFKVTIDGKAPGADAGTDVEANGFGTVTDERLYQLVRQEGAVRDRTFRIEFLDPGVEAFAFTFG